MKSRFIYQKGLLHKTLMHEFYHMARIIQYICAFHLFFIMLYKYFKWENDNKTINDTIIYVGVPIFFCVSAILYETIKRKMIFARLKKEEWIPIITPKGDVTGKIAKSVSLNMKNRFMHPIVRVALISDDKIYLQKRTADNVLNPDKLDYPLEEYMLFNHDINLAAKNSIARMMGNYDSAGLKFILKYSFENENTNRLIFLFSINVDEDSIEKYGKKMTGKYWTIKQIEENFKDEIFGECFELEFEYMKNVVLHTQRERTVN